MSILTSNHLSIGNKKGLSELDNLFDENSYTGQIMKNRGAKALLRYLKTSQIYSIATSSAHWSYPKETRLHGLLGHHAMIRLPGKRVCEWTPTKDPTDDRVQSITQVEIRRATGKEIEAMWQTHCRLAPLYRAVLDNEGYAPKGLYYCPFVNDCFSYANRILTENNQPETHLKRVNLSEVFND